MVSQQFNIIIIAKIKNTAISHLKMATCFSFDSFRICCVFFIKKDLSKEERILENHRQVFV